MNVLKILLTSALLIAWFPLAAAERPPDILVLMAEDLSARIGAFDDDVARCARRQPRFHTVRCPRRP